MAEVVGEVEEDMKKVEVERMMCVLQVVWEV